jgi:hypothetical protein
LLDEFDELLELELLDELDELFELELLDELDELLEDELPARMIWPLTPFTWPPFSTAPAGGAAASAPWAPMAAARVAAATMICFFMSVPFKHRCMGNHHGLRDSERIALNLYSRPDRE